MEELSIKIKIGDREYPMKVRPDDEERVRKAGRIINEQIKTYRNQFGLEDKQDLLAMVAFDSVVEKLNQTQKSDELDHDILEKINNLNHSVSQVLQ